VIANPQATGRGDQLTLDQYSTFLSKSKVFTYRKSAPLPGAGGSEIQRQILQDFENQNLIKIIRAFFFDVLMRLPCIPHCVRFCEFEIVKLAKIGVLESHLHKFSRSEV
jgi:hypothetical protein